MDHKDQDIFVCIRNRDHAGLAEWLLFLLEMANEDAQRGLTGVMRYDGAILVPLLQLGDASFSKALLSDPRVTQAPLVSAQHVAHSGKSVPWILGYAPRSAGDSCWTWNSFWHSGTKTGIGAGAGHRAYGRAGDDCYGV